MNINNLRTALVIAAWLVAIAVVILIGSLYLEFVALLAPAAPPAGSQ